jgi:hypothetical protein
MWPWLALVMGNAFMKGAVSGIGLVSVTAAVGEMLALITRTPDDVAASSDEAPSLRRHGA